MCRRCDRWCARLTVDSGHEDGSGDEDEVEQLVAALCSRLAEVLPRDRFEVTVEHRHAIRICGVGSRRGEVHWLSPIPLWRSRSPVEHRLRLFLEAAGSGLQRFVSRHDRPWPTATAESKVCIGQESIVIWWGGESEADAVVALRPILRSEIGV